MDSRVKPENDEGTRVKKLTFDVVGCHKPFSFFILEIDPKIHAATAEPPQTATAWNAVEPHASIWPAWLAAKSIRKAEAPVDDRRF